MLDKADIEEALSDTCIKQNSSKTANMPEQNEVCDISDYCDCHDILEVECDTCSLIIGIKTKIVVAENR